MIKYTYDLLSGQARSGHIVSRLELGQNDGIKSAVATLHFSCWAIFVTFEHNSQDGVSPLDMFFDTA